jgi:hypothetical protein
VPASARAVTAFPRSYDSPNGSDTT